ncbi:MAG: YfiR family protein [Pseudomonadales bacterium]
MSDFDNKMLALKRHRYFSSTPKIFDHKVLLFVLVISSAPVLSSDLDREMLLKSGFIYNFSRLGQWGAGLSNKDNFTICSPDEGFIKVAEITFVNKRIKNSPIVIDKTDINSDVKNCNVVFITKKYYSAWKSRKNKLKNKQVMLIGENKGFIKSGGHINFFILSGKIRFEVSINRLKSSGLQLSSKVLRLGKIHRENSHE